MKKKSKLFSAHTFKKSNFPTDFDGKMDMEIADRWFKFIQSGDKVVEGRVLKTKFLTLVTGTILNITNESNENIRCRVIDIRPYSSFRKYLEQEGLRRTLPGVSTVAEGLDVYAQYFPPGLDEKLGVIAIEMVKIE